MPKEENKYGRLLTDEQIGLGEHRTMVGGLWDTIGPLQLSFLRSRGLRPHHKLVDVGCGALRGGIHFVRYLDAGGYFGIDLNESLIRAGKKELDDAGLSDRAATLIVNEHFEVFRFNQRFDFALAVSLLTHLGAESIHRCLREVAKVLKPRGEFYATFYPAPESGHAEPIEQWPGVFTHLGTDPFHYSIREIEACARNSGLKTDFIGPWGHPRNQQMLRFVPR